MATIEPSSRSSTRRVWTLCGVSLVLASGLASSVAACSSDEPEVVTSYDAGNTQIGVSDGEAPESGAVDASQEEEAATDAGDTDVDAGGDPFGDFADAGTECPRVNLIQERACENGCAKQARVCLPPEDAGADAGTLVWQPWGECISVIDNGCNPGEQRGTSCGRCGVKLETCQADCTFSGGVCMAEGPCTPDQTERVNNLSCEGGYRERVCTKGCQWGPFGDCIIPTPP